MITRTVFIRQPELIEHMGKIIPHIAVEKYDVHKVNAVILKTMDLSHESHEYTRIRKGL